MEPVRPDIHFPTLEKQITEFWKKNDIPARGLAANANSRPFVFYDGPPFATGLPHYGHILAGTLKDIVPRYWVMKGRNVERRWGWDCHGLPVEFELEKELGLDGLEEVKRFGIAKFNEACRSIVQRYTREWEEIISRTGRWADFRHCYRTMDVGFMESVWWVTAQLWKRGLIYEGYRVMPYSWRISTPLANFEAGLNYKDVQDPAVTVKFASLDGKRFFLAWTTTPWTLPSNLSLAVHPEENYVEIKEQKSGDVFVLAEKRLSALFSDPAQYTVLQTKKGAALKGEQYHPLFPYFEAESKRNAFRVLTDDYVTMTDGTGIVHQAPAFGEEDFRVCRANGIGIVDPVDAEGRFTDLVPDFKGLHVKEADRGIIQWLKAQGKLYRHDTIMHSYPFCWRSDTPLIYKAISTWFLKLEPLKEGLIASNKTTHWVPEHVRDGRFGNWLENARDWNISRNRFWGTPIPIWRSEDKSEAICIGSLDELEKLSGHRPSDIHKHFVDDIEIKSPTSGKILRRIPEVFDCWFESGSMPYAASHYPFENQDKLQTRFPADFIAEGIDQTRGWFYTLSVLSQALFGQAPFRNVMVNGLVLAEDGKKMSKRLKNYPDPVHVLDTYGADALRVYLMNSPASHAEDLRFSEKGVQEVLRSVLLPLWNAYSFLVTYARADGWKATDASDAILNGNQNPMDQWVLSRLQSLIQDMDAKMENYHLYEVIPDVLQFIEELTNWYIRLNRRRFWSDEKTSDKEEAYNTLYYVISNFSQVLAPIVPFVSEAIYQNLRSPTSADSVHLSHFPKVRKEWLRPELEARMRLIQNVVFMGRTCRNTHKLKTRQPLKEIIILTGHPEDRDTIEAYRTLIENELNVKKVSFSSDESKYVDLRAKPNAKVLGPRLGGSMKAVMEKIRGLRPEDVANLEKTGEIEILGHKLQASDFVIERQPKLQGAIQSLGNVTIWLDSTLSPELIAEGQARELVNRIQKYRKDLGLEVTDRIQVGYKASAALTNAFEQFRDYISEETLATKFAASASLEESVSEQDIDGEKVLLEIKRVN